MVKVRRDSCDKGTLKFILGFGEKFIWVIIGWLILLADWLLSNIVLNEWWCKNI